MGHQFQGAAGTHPKSCASWDFKQFSVVFLLADTLLTPVCRVRTRVSHVGLFFASVSRRTCVLSSHSHFGTDTAGVNTARRYLCEALSFHYRYVPIGILECLPPRVNDRAPLFRGRDELGGYRCGVFFNVGSLTSSMRKKRFWRVVIVAIG